MYTSWDHRTFKSYIFPIFGFVIVQLISSLSSELQSVTRQLLDLEASSSLAIAMDKVIPKNDVETDTQELDEAREYSDSVMAERLMVLVQRAKSAELKVTDQDPLNNFPNCIFNFKFVWSSDNYYLKYFAAFVVCKVSPFSQITLLQENMLFSCLLNFRK